jgi:hypothetical protein
MLPKSDFKSLAKNDRRKQWKLLKAKHQAALTAAQVDFDLKFGSALDKHVAEIDKLSKLSAKREVNRKDLKAVLASAEAVNKIALSYHAKVKTLTGPAKKELGAFLKALDADGDAWKALAVSLQGQPAAAVGEAEKNAAARVGINLDNLLALSVQVVRHGERALIVYQSATPPRPEAAALTSRIVEAARLVGVNVHEVIEASNLASQGSNYALFKQRAIALVPLLTRLRNAMKKFNAQWKKNLPGHTMSSNTDAMGLKGNYVQINATCGYAIDRIAELP